MTDEGGRLTTKHRDAMIGDPTQFSVCDSMSHNNLAIVRGSWFDVRRSASTFVVRGCGYEQRTSNREPRTRMTHDEPRTTNRSTRATPWPDRPACRGQGPWLSEFP